MAELPVRLLGKSFNIICNDGEEAHITQLVEYLSQRVDEVSATSRDTNSLYVMLMSALLVCDDLFATRAEMEKMSLIEQEKSNEIPHDTSTNSNNELPSLVSGLEVTLKNLEALCKRLEM